MKKYISGLFILLLLSCSLDIDYRMYEKHISLPLMGTQGAVSLNFYAVKRIPLETLRELDIKDAYFNFTATSTKNMTFKIMVQDTGPKEDTKLYAVCSPDFACQGIYAVYERTPDYIVQSPTLISGSVNGTKDFQDVRPEEEALRKIENAFSKGYIWVVVNVSTTDPLYFTQSDSLYINNLEGYFDIEKDMTQFQGIAGGVF